MENISFFNTTLKQLLQKRSAAFFVVRLFFYISISGLILYFCSRIDRQEETTDTEPQYTSVSASFNVPYKQLFSYIVRPGDTFAGILSQFDIPETQAVYFYRSLKAIGFSTLFPGDSLVLTKNADATVQSFSLLNRLSFWYHVSQNENALQVEKKPLEVSSYLCIVKGTLESSLSEDMFKLGVGDAIVIQLADIFAWDINFFMDPRKGDRFEVIFEKQYRDGIFLGYGRIRAAKYVNVDKAFFALGMHDTNNTLHYYDLQGKSVQKEFLKAPLRYNRISSGFSYRRKHPILGIFRPHLGIDYAAPRGTPVHSSADGIVTFTGYDNQYGNQVRIRNGASYETSYGHLHTVARGIYKGVRVSQGQLIGTVGSTGLATGPHLDYRMKISGRFVNPRTIDMPAKEGVSSHDFPEFTRLKQQFCSLLDSRFEHDGCYVLAILMPENQGKDMATQSTIQELAYDAPASP